MPDGSWKEEGQFEMMVQLDSARLWYPREARVACNADHSQIAKLKCGEGSIYPSVRWAIKQALLSAADLYNRGEQKGKTANDVSDNDAAPHPRILHSSHRRSSISSEPRAPGLLVEQSRSLSEGAIDQHAEIQSA